MSEAGQILVFNLEKKVEFAEAGTGNSWGGRLGYKWKHFVQTARQGLFHLELLTPPHGVGLSFQLHLFILCHKLFLLTTSASNISRSLFLFCKVSHQPIPFALLCMSSRVTWCSRTATAALSSAVIYGGRQHRWMLPFAPSLTLCTQQWEQRTAGPFALPQRYYCGNGTDKSGVSTSFCEKRQSRHFLNRLGP